MINGVGSSSYVVSPGCCAACGGTSGHHRLDQRGVGRPQGKGCDIGAYKREVSSVTGDLNGDGTVNVFDLLTLLENWG